MAEGGSSSMLLDDPRWPRKGYLNKVLKWVKGLPWAWHGKSSEILQQRAVAEDQSSSHQSRDEMDLVDSCNSSGSSDDFHESVAEGESISMSLDDPRRSGKGYFDRALKWVKKVSCEWDGKSSELLPQHEELRSSLGLVGDFSYKELCRATGNFSDTIGSGGFSKVYRGQLMNGQSSSHQSRDEMDLVDSFNSSGSSDDFHESVAEGESISMSLDDPRRSGKSYFDRALKWVKKVSCERDGKSSELLPQHAELRSSLGLVGDFSYKELCRATGNFSDTIGSGGFSKVYRGQLMNGQSIAVKVYEAGWKFAKVTIQGLRTASQLQHGNIVPLLGCCLQERKNLLLVYEYMPNGDLGKHIFSQAGERVFGTWQQRYKIVGQVAAAIKYLHQDSGNRQIVHGDVKTSNIMLDSEWNARLGDCGLAIMLEEGHSLTDIAVAGTMGLLDPDYRCQGTLKPAFDVYSFGMMVLEITTGRRAYSPMPDEQDNHVLREWVWELYQNGSEVLRAADVRLTGNFDESEMRRSLVLGLACTNRDPQARPTIEDVLRILSMASDPPPPQDWSVRL